MGFVELEGEVEVYACEKISPMRLLRTEIPALTQRCQTHIHIQLQRMVKDTQQVLGRIKGVC